MSTPVTFNGASYSVPAYNDSGWAQGSGNLSLYLIAIAQGTLQTTGGSFTLSADVNFGSTYGVLSKYFTSVSASPATAGAVRLAIGDTIDWGTANNALSVSGTSLQWNGVTIQAVANAAVWYSSTFSNQSSVTVTHNLGHYPMVQCIDGSGNVFDPNTVTHGSVNAFTVTFIPNATGTIIYVG